MKRYGTDSLNSWIIAVACCFCNTMIFGLARLSGMLFIASVSRFSVSREKASLPYTLATFMRNALGPIVGCLGHRFGVRFVTTLGCLIGAVGVATCFFAENIDSVTVLWGGVFGVGYGLGNVLLPVAINQHFDKHRATASGISFSGASLGSFILPPILDLLLNNYGLSGTYLLLSGLILNCVPVALLLKEPKSLYNNKEYSNVFEKNNKCYIVEDNCEKCVPKDSSKDVKNMNNPIRQIYSQQAPLTYAEKVRGLSTQTLLSEYSIRMSISEPLDMEHIMENSKGRRRVDSKVIHAEVLSLASHDTEQDWHNDNVIEVRSSSVQYDKPILIDSYARKRSQSLNSKGRFVAQCDLNEYNYTYPNTLESLNSEQKSYEVISCLNLEDKLQGNKISKYTENRHEENDDKSKNAIIDSKNATAKNIHEISSEKTFVSGSKATYPDSVKSGSKAKSCHGIFRIIMDPIFILISLTYGIYTFIFVCVFTVIVDFAHDLNIEPSNEKYILMALSIGDIIGRLGLGWVTDRGYMTTTGFTAFLFACEGLTIAAIVFSRGLMTLLLFATLYGLAEAGLIVLFPVILAQYLEHDKQTVAIPSSNFLAGPLCLAVAPLIGLCRDRLGTYSYLYYVMVVLSFVCCIIWILAPAFVKQQKLNRRNKM